MTSLALPARAVIDPVDGVRASVESRRWVWPLLLLCLSVSVHGTAYSLRWDPAPSVTQQLQMSGELGRQSEAEIDEAIETAGRKALVGGISKGVFVKPLTVLGPPAAPFVSDGTAPCATAGKTRPSPKTPARW